LPRFRSTSSTVSASSSSARHIASDASRTIASSRRSHSRFPSHAAISARSSSSLSFGITLRTVFGGDMPASGSPSVSPSSASHAPSRRSDRYLTLAVAGSAPCASRPAIYAAAVRLSGTPGRPCPAHQSRYWRADAM